MDQGDVHDHFNSFMFTETYKLYIFALKYKINLCLITLL